MDKANYYASSAQWELAENCFREIQRLYENERLPVAMEVDLCLNLARVAGFQGKHQDAIEALMKAANVQGTNDKQKCQIYGELGINYNRTDRTLEAADMFQRQFDLSTKMAFEMDAETCRAAGNLGHAHLQLHMRHAQGADRQDLLGSAMNLQTQRIEMAQMLMDKLQGWQNMHGKRNMHGFSQSWINYWLGKLWLWGVIGISRSVLTYIAAGQLDNASASGHQAVEMTKDAAGADPTIRALSRFMYGHALLHSGDVTNAKMQFNYPHSSTPGIIGVCTPAIALCRESSAEHRLYLQEVIQQGVDLTAYDEQGYSALDYAVFSNDHEAVDMIKEGLNSQIDVQSIAQVYKMAQIRRHFREIFHSRFRPIIQNGHAQCMRDLRSEYVELLSAQAEKRQCFDRLRAVRYADFKNHAALPHWSANTNHLTMDYEKIKEKCTREPLFVFFSYRWVGRSQDCDKRSPDNDRHYQYRRMVDALGQLLLKHPEVDEQDLYIWLVGVARESTVSRNHSNDADFCRILHASIKKIKNLAEGKGVSTPCRSL
jgi:tetratricopeptide (TPR) repeat protein